MAADYFVKDGALLRDRVVKWAIALAALLCSTAAQAQAPAAPPKNDYSAGQNWLCRPGRSDACARANEDATIVRVDGTTSVEHFTPAASPPVDCFYVYPTVSRERAGNASMVEGPEEVRVVEQQLARFGSVCRLYAPLYRQVTLAGLRSALIDGDAAIDKARAYQDVADAWSYYLAHDNQGRGVVLIGHSQGAKILVELVKRAVEGQPVQRQLLSVILAGGHLQVPTGQDVGGDFASVPLCKTSRQLGCAINFASFRSDSPPPHNARFGGSDHPGWEAACVNPAALAGGRSDGPLQAYMPTVARGQHLQWTTLSSAPPIATPFVALPGLLTASCVRAGGFNYLAVTVHPSADGKRANDIPGDLVVAGHRLAGWGLHVVDVNLTIGNLVEVVRDEAAAYAARRGPSAPKK